MGQKKYEINEKDLINMNLDSLEPEDQEIVEKSSFQYINIVGRGGFGKVWKVLHKKSNKIYAMKEMSKVKILERKSEISIKNERTFLSKIFHPFIVNMHYAFQDNDNLYLIIDYLSGGDLRYQYCFDREFTEEQVKFFISCIILSLEYLHSNNILHRDIKPENLIFDQNGYIKLTDFGISKIYNKNIDNSKENSGTLGYIAPEVLFHLKHDYRCDYYALGIVGYELMTNERPYVCNNRNDERELLLSKEFMITKKTLKMGWSVNFMDFINQLIKKKPEERLGKNGIEEIKTHPWLKYFNWKDLYLMKIKAPFIPSQKDNFDSKYCNMEENIPKELQIKYKNIINSIRYKYIFEDYKYYNRNKDNLINKAINKEMNISKNIFSLLQNENGRKSKITRNYNGYLYKTSWKKYTMDNLNNMISQYKSMDGNKNNFEEENKNDEINDFDNKNNEEDLISDDMKICINPHLVYRALEQKEIECLSDDEIGKNKSKNMKKYIYKNKSPIKLKKKNVVGRNQNLLKEFKSNPEIENNRIKINKNKEDNFINNKNANINNKVSKINENNKKQKFDNDKKEKNINNIKVNVISNKYYKNEKGKYKLDKIDLNNNNKNKDNNIIKVNINKKLKQKKFQQ